MRRPDHFLRKDGSMPETAELELVCPPGFESVKAFRDQLVAQVTTLEDQT